MDAAELAQEVVEVTIGRLVSGHNGGLPQDEIEEARITFGGKKKETRNRHSPRRGSLVGQRHPPWHGRKRAREILGNFFDVARQPMLKPCKSLESPSVLGALRCKVENEENSIRNHAYIGTLGRARGVVFTNSSSNTMNAAMWRFSETGHETHLR